MIAEAKIIWWSDLGRDIEQKVKDCTACLQQVRVLNTKAKKLGRKNQKHYLNRDENYK